MTSLPPEAVTATAPLPLGQRLHAWLMPDYNRKATGYWCCVVALGLVILLNAISVVASAPAASLMLIAAGTAIAMLAGMFPVRIPGSKNSFATGEVFLFLLLLLHGPEAATLAAVGEAALGSWRTSKRWTSRIISPAIAAVVMFSTGTLMQMVLEAMRQSGTLNDGLLMIVAMAFALVYFVVSTLLVSAVPRLKRNERLQWTDVIGTFGWVGVAYGASSALASLLFITYRTSGIGVLMAVVPLLAMLLATLHYFFKQQEINEAARAAAAQVSEREEAAQARHVRELEASERRFHSAFTHASIGMALVTFDGDILQTNTALCELLGSPTGAQAGGLLQRNLSQIALADDMPQLAAQLHQLQQGQIEDAALEMRWRHSDGTELWVAVHGSLFSEPGSHLPCLILQAHDITARRRAEADLQHIAFHDALTGLPNRRRFHEHLAQAVQDAKADPEQHRFAVMFLDFDRFKLINDSLGHNAGDEFLVQVARRLQEKLRPNDVVARLGGDEFAVLARELECDEAALQLGDRLLVTLRRPFYVAGTDLNTSASIGITRSSFGYDSPEDVLRDADIAMYKAKALGKARYALFDKGLHAQVSRRLQLEGDLRQALTNGRLTVAYQPLFTLDDGHLSGFEALARWTHPTLGVIGPDVFIPIAEEAGLIMQLTDLVLQRACRQLKQWQLRDASLANLTVQINISGKDLGHAGLVGRVSQALLEAGVRARHLTLELTENILMNQIEIALPMLEQLRALGVGLSVDDFGTGYSSLSHLSTLPIDSLKVDRSFVHGLRSDTKEAAVVRAVVQLGLSLGKSVVAEGIETPAQLAHLREMGCNLGQGFHLGRPLTTEQVDRLLDDLVRTAVRPDATEIAPPALAPVAAKVLPLDLATRH